MEQIAVFQIHPDFEAILVYAVILMKSYWMNVLKSSVWLESVIRAQSTVLGLFSLDVDRFK